MGLYGDGNPGRACDVVVVGTQEEGLRMAKVIQIVSHGQDAVALELVGTPSGLQVEITRLCKGVVAGVKTERMWMVVLPAEMFIAAMDDMAKTLKEWEAHLSPPAADGPAQDDSSGT